MQQPHHQYGQVPPPVFSGEPPPLSDPTAVPGEAAPGSHMAAPTGYMGPPTGVPGSGPGAPVFPTVHGMPPGPVVPPSGVQGPPRKSRVGLIVALVAVAALFICGGGGVAVWYFLLQEPEDLVVYPASHERVVDPAPTAFYTFDESLDTCSVVDWSPVTSFMDFDSAVEPEAERGSDGIGIYQCTATFRGENAYRNYAPVGTYLIWVAVFDDAAAAQTFYDETLVDDEGRYTRIDVDDVGETAAAFNSTQGTAHEIRLNVLNGNVFASSSLAYSSGQYFAAPDHTMMLDSSADMMNGFLTALQ